ncbi:MAG: hypothetical protein KIT31_22115 [Deltaproteobacteria bacterium]|nr:hypothetical protein [Deltaproteobacteria bacterium]
MRALTRHVPASFAHALSATPPDPPIDVALARAQHAAYRAALAACGAAVTAIDADEACPDCVFVEDTAVVAGGIALVTRPGAPSRRGETPPIARALARHVDLAWMDTPATLDGGDCLRVGRTIYAGRSARTNAAGIARLAEVFADHTVVAVDLPRTSCTSSACARRSATAASSSPRARSRPSCSRRTRSSGSPRPRRTRPTPSRSAATSSSPTATRARARPSRPPASPRTPSRTPRCARPTAR